MIDLTVGGILFNFWFYEKNKWYVRGNREIHLSKMERAKIGWKRYRVFGKGE